MGPPQDKLINHKTPPMTGNLPLPPSPMPAYSDHSEGSISLGTEQERAMNTIRSEAASALKEQGLGEGLTKPQSLHVQEELDKLSEMFPSMDRNSIKDFIKDQLKRDLEQEGEGTFSWNKVEKFIDAMPLQKGDDLTS